jgi:pSer/pThr/pTyr-binding forkhead associated (FHA) protein
MSQKPLLVSSTQSANGTLIKIVSGPHKGESFSLTKNTFTIGRNPDNDIVLPNDNKISRTHVTVTKRNSIYIVENLSLRNPIMQNLEQKNKLEIKSSGQKFQIGESEIEFVWEDPEFKKTTSEKPLVSIPNPVGPNIVMPNVSLANNPAIPKNTYNIPVQSGTKKINITINQNYEQLNKNTIIKKKSKPKAKNNPLLFIILIVVALIFFFLPDKDASKKLKKSNLRSSEEIQKSLESSKINIDTYQKEKRIQDDGSIEKQFESAQSYYIRGFRDYRQGQFARAIQAFQAALSFDPNHILARKYLSLSLKKLDETVQFNLNQGRRYREKSNYRLCKSAFQQVMIIKKDPNDTVYKEAKQLYNECDTLHKGRY